MDHRRGRLSYVNGSAAAGCRQDVDNAVAHRRTDRNPADENNR
jgi:hypothetical protein